MSVTNKMKPGFRGLTSGLFGTPPQTVPSSPLSNLASADLFYPEGRLPDSVQAAVTAYLSQPEAAHYAHPLGLPSLREAIGQRLTERYHFPVDTNRHIFITPGSEPALQLALVPFIEPGDEVMIPDPSYLANSIDTRALGGTVVEVPLDPEHNFPLDVSAFEARLTPNTKAVILTTPNNPAGTVYGREELECFCAFLVKNDLILLCDCAFDDYVFDGLEAVWPATLPGMWERTVSLFTFSKGYGVCGLRVGYMVADTPVLDALLAKMPALMGSVSNLAQVGAQALLNDRSIPERYQQRLERRRKFTYDKLSAVPGLSLHIPQAGFQFWIDVSQLGTAPDVIRYLRENAQVQVNNGSAFGSVNGPRHIRLVFGCIDDDQLYDSAVNRICEALKHYPQT